MNQENDRHPLLHRQEEEATQCLDASSQGMEERKCSHSQDPVSDGGSQRSEEDVSECEIPPGGPDDPSNPSTGSLDHSLLATSNLDSYTRNLEKVKRKSAPCFLDDEQLELFCLLPLSNKQRVELLDTIRKQ